jgi:ABC-type nitrate/sulfonate/bicarbonate transport system substrate-binding protein
LNVTGTVKANGQSADGAITPKEAWAAMERRRIDVLCFGDTWGAMLETPDGNKSALGSTPLEAVQNLLAKIGAAHG